MSEPAAMNDNISKQLTDLAVAQREIITNQANQQKLLEEHSALLKAQGDTLLRNTITVERHEQRSFYLEEMFKVLKKEFDPIKQHVSNLQSIWKASKWIIGTMLTLIGVAAAVYEALK